MTCRRHLLALLCLVGAPSCFTPTWEARLAEDGGTGKGSDGGGGLECKPACPAGFFCEDGVCRPCSRDCRGRRCGDDGCGGSCGDCEVGVFCDSRGQCGACEAALRCGTNCCARDQACVNGECVTCGCGTRVCGTGHCGEPCGPGCRPDQVCTTDGRCVGGTCGCDGRQCGEDGCGNVCGYCTAPEVCTPLGQCLATPCTCEGKQCGDDGCGRDCGACPPNSWCLDGKCTCQRLCDWLECGDDGCGGSCGECAPGSTCQWGTCVPATCEPPCDQFQWCDTSPRWPVCVEICNAPMGCGPGEICDVMSGKCLPATCNPALCGAGQGCYDPWTMGPGNVCTCLPGRYDANGVWLEDTCAASGLACPWDYTNPEASECGTPGEFDECQPALGCQTGLECVDFGGGYRVCLQPCTLSKDCLNPMTNCLAAAKRHCWWAICAQPDSSPADRQRYFKPCASGSASDGLCLPYLSQDSAGNPVDLGVCVQTGTAPSLGKCSADADRTRMSELCPQGQWCEPSQPDPNRPGEQLGVCRAACNPAPAPVPVKACASTAEVCADLSGAQQGTMNEARLGACHPACDLLGTGACPADAQGNPGGCMPNFNLDGTGFCYAQAPQAAGKGQPCTWDTALDPRNPCADRLYCNDPGGGGACSGFCDTAVCADPSQSCPACAPFTVCYPLGGNFGVCL